MYFISKKNLWNCISLLLCLNLYMVITHAQHDKERIQINFKPIKDSEIEIFINQYKKHIKEARVTFFELMTVMALWHFKQNNVVSKNGEELNTDFGRMISLIKSYNFKGFMSIEYEGAFSGYLDNHDGILATKKLIEKYL